MVPVVWKTTKGNHHCPDAFGALLQSLLGGAQTWIESFLFRLENHDLGGLLRAGKTQTVLDLTVWLPFCVCFCFWISLPLLTGRMGVWALYPVPRGGWNKSPWMGWFKTRICNSPPPNIAQRAGS